MSRLTRDEVRQIAVLSRLEFSDDEADRFADQLTSILDYVEKLNELDVDGVEPSAHALTIRNVMREDETRPSLDRDAALNCAAESEAGCFRVPPIIQEQ